MRADMMLPMLCIPEKTTKSVDLCGPLLLDISQRNPEREAQDLEYDLQTLNKHRSQLAKPHKKSSLTARLGHLQSYFRALCRIRTLFPSPKDQINNLAFTWYDAFKQNEKASQQNIHLEKAAVLFNLGAVYSQIGKNRDRSTVEEQRQAAKEFRLAAGAFAYLKDTVATEASMGESTTVDVSVECAGMLEKLMLAQAQECWFEIAVAKGKSPGACEMISRQVALYYEEALAALKATPLKGHVDQKWKPYLQLKAALFNAEACYRHGLKLHEEDGLDEEIAWLNSGISTLSKAKKSRKGGLALFLGLSTKIKKISDAIEKLEANMNRSLTMAKKDPGYTGRVSSADSLSSLQPHSMVEQPISIDEVLGASNKKLFASLVPHSSAKALSMYGELVGGVIQTHEIKLQLCSELIRTRLEEMDLPDYTLTLEGQLTLPANLKEVVETLQVNGGLATLEAELVQLGDLRRVTQELVVQTEKHLQSKPQSSTQSNDLQDRFNRITDNLKQGAETDAEIECLMKYRSTLMSIL